jgi:hypothetical protein
MMALGRLDFSLHPYMVVLPLKYQWVKDYQKYLAIDLQEIIGLILC